MIKKIIEFSAHNRFLVIFLTAIAVLGGIYSLKKIPLDAIPDLSDTQVIIYSKWDRSPDIMENQVTYPIVSSLLGSPKVKSVRGFSDYGFSYVYVIFEDGVDLYWARSRVLENLNRITSQIPTGVKTEIGPDATSVGWVYQYTLQDNSGKFNAADLRSMQDWLLRFQLQSVPGVSEVASIGGFVKQYQIKIDPTKLLLYQVTMDQVLSAVKNSNQESGGRTIEFSGTEAMVRSQGLVDKVEDIEEAVVSYNPRSRAPILIKQVGTVSIGPEMRRGITDFNGLGNAVGGIIVMRQGEDAPEVISRVKEKIDQIQKTLPEGVKIVSIYDRSSLIDRAMETLRSTLIEELIIVSIIILIFLWHIPSAIVPIVTIPISILIAFIPLYFTGQSSNIMSLAGIAISIGVLVDGAIVEVENAYRKIQHWDKGGRKGDFFTVRLEALTEVGPSVFFSLLVIAVAFIPIFTLVDQEGRLFRPLALSKNLVMAVAAFLAITLDPAMRMLFARIDPIEIKNKWMHKIVNSIFVGTYYSEHKHPITKKLFAIYEPVIDWVLKHKKITLGIALAAMISVIPGFMMLGSEFMPKLHEGSLLYMPTALPGISVSEAQRILTKQDQILKSFPEVDTVFGKAGRAETSTDTAPLSMIETTITLKERSHWRKTERWYSSIPNFMKWPFERIWPETITEEQLIDEMNEKLSFIGMPNIWTMPIKNRIDMLSTGIRSPIGIKIFGPNLKTIQTIGENLEKELKTLEGTRTIIAERIASGYFLDIDFDREKLKFYGLSLKDAQDQAMVSIGGDNVSQLIASRERYPIQVRLAPAFRQDIESIKRVLITSSTGTQIPLSEIAKVHFNEGPSMIRDENASLVGYVYIDIDPNKTDIGRYVDNAKKIVENKIKLPTGYLIAWSGQFENMERVKERLKIVIPITLLLIIFLLHFNTKSWVKTAIVLLAVPFSMIGAVWLLVALGYNLSIAAWVGMIALLGLDAETGVFMLMYLDLSFDERVKKNQMNSLDDLKHAVVEGAVHRVRPKLMTVAALFMGLIPIMWSIGAGADVMKRIAAPMIGGLFTSFLLELLIYPVVFYIWKGMTEFKMKLKELL
ncbi:CusA/CzcA family heavy metal efflux RND transporter [Bacteriovorax stolpii]|uniref:efflux RND transporter permease subunit n=1 Tax=Bacteriovorax stolpii TaxID=960 RepID=UPI001159DF9F|nr:CusA/CzcA family heavy metal efflux RND transporter [Bacteriovorax stolpii]QDK42365.1 CusA/CzcA family heavy metal efflux RND transporter [Bacteriovorax stolpii]